jgi:hypothetical protein
MSSRKEGAVLPKEKLDIETDRNPSTAYEDTAPHERVGVRADDTKPLSSNGNPNDKVDNIGT